MHVILTKEGAAVGEPASVIDVAPGYARFLVSRRMARFATPSALRAAEDAKAQAQRVAEQVDRHAQTAVEAITGRTITIVAKAMGESLFGAIGATEIAATIARECGIDIPEAAVLVERPFKRTGTYAVALDVMGHKGAFTLNIDAEGK